MSVSRVSKLALLVVAILVAMPPLADAGPRDHIGGFFLRLSAGGGAANTKIDDTLVTGFNEFKLSGPAGNVNFAIGGMVANNFALHGTIWGWLVSNPDVEADGQTGNADADLNMSAIGPGFTYYFMPVNMYLSSSIGAAVGTIETHAGNTTVTYDTDVGFALDVTLGKEWWVGDKWGLGIAAAFGYHSIPDPNSEKNWSGTDFSLRFSATLN